MTKTFITASTLTGLVLAGGLASMVSAQSAAEATGLTEDQIIEIALTEVPGEVLEIEQETHKGKEIFEVEVLAEDGDEFELAILASTGEVLKVREEGDDCDKGRDHDEDEDDDDAEDA